MQLLLEILFFTASAMQVPQADFPTLMDDAMMRMHRAMHVPYSGDADRDFAAMMIPHHEGAVDMAKLELQYGKDERLRRLAQGIIVEQQQEIALMQDILRSLKGSPAATSTREPSPHTPR